jgi:hypothetical protein
MCAAPHRFALRQLYGSAISSNDCEASFTFVDECAAGFTFATGVVEGRLR